MTNESQDSDKPQKADCPSAPCSACGCDPYVIEAAKAAVNTLVRENERLRDARAKAENGECLLELTVGMMTQDMETIREIITKGGNAADILKFLDTPNA